MVYNRLTTTTFFQGRQSKHTSVSDLDTISGMRNDPDVVRESDKFNACQNSSSSKILANYQKLELDNRLNNLIHNMPIITKPPTVKIRYRLVKTEPCLINSRIFTLKNDAPIPEIANLVPLHVSDIDKKRDPFDQFDYQSISGFFNSIQFESYKIISFNQYPTLRIATGMENIFNNCFFFFFFHEH